MYYWQKPLVSCSSVASFQSFEEMHIGKLAYLLSFGGLISQHTSTWGKMAQLTSLGVPAAGWPDHTWNPGDKHSAARLKVKVWAYLTSGGSVGGSYVSF